jgi:hypothetical protein
MRREEPESLARHLRGELDWITMKALERIAPDVMLRPQSWRPTSSVTCRINLCWQGRLASATYRARKFIRRHRFGVGVAVAAVALLVAFAATMAVQARRIAKERDRANREAETSKRVSEFMTNMFKVSDPGQARGNSITAREILDKASKDIGTGLSKDPAVQAQMMHVRAHATRRGCP